MADGNYLAMARMHFIRTIALSHYRAIQHIADSKKKKKPTTNLQFAIGYQPFATRYFFRSITYSVNCINA